MDKFLNDFLDAIIKFDDYILWKNYGVIPAVMKDEEFILIRKTVLKIRKERQYIMKRAYQNADEELEKQTWDMFAEEIREKKVVLFGVGILTFLYFFRFPDIHVELIVDNDVEKQGDTLGEYVLGNICKKDTEKIIVSFSELKKFNPQEVVILISSIWHDKAISEQLKKEGYLNCYSLNIMEENQPTDLQAEGNTSKERLLNMYIRQCCQSAIEKKIGDL